MKSTNLRDKDGNEIFIGSEVTLPDPTENDNWNHSFSANVKSVRNIQTVNGTEQVLIVADSDDEWFTVEPNRIEVEDSV